MDDHSEDEANVEQLLKSHTLSEQDLVKMFSKYWSYLMELNVRKDFIVKDL